MSPPHAAVEGPSLDRAGPGGPDHLNQHPDSPNDQCPRNDGENESECPPDTDTCRVPRHYVMSRAHRF
jgi:hypothetical protein